MQGRKLPPPPPVVVKPVRPSGMEDSSHAMERRIPQTFPDGTTAEQIKAQCSWPATATWLPSSRLWVLCWLLGEITGAREECQADLNRLFALARKAVGRRFDFQMGAPCTTAAGGAVRVCGAANAVV